MKISNFLGGCEAVRGSWLGKVSLILEEPSKSQERCIREVYEILEWEINFLEYHPISKSRTSKKFGEFLQGEDSTEGQNDGERR